MDPKTNKRKFDTITPLDQLNMETSKRLKKSKQLIKSNGKSKEKIKGSSKEGSPNKPNRQNKGRDVLGKRS